MTPYRLLLVELLRATVFMILVQGIWNPFTLDQLVALFINADGDTDPSRKAFLLHAICLWSRITIVSSVGEFKLSATINAGFWQLTLFAHSSLLPHSLPEGANSVDVERLTCLSNDRARRNAICINPYLNYGTLAKPPADTIIDGSSTLLFWVSDSG